MAQHNIVIEDTLFCQLLSSSFHCKVCCLLRVYFFNLIFPQTRNRRLCSNKNGAFYYIRSTHLLQALDKKLFKMKGAQVDSIGVAIEEQPTNIVSAAYQVGRYLQVGLYHQDLP